MILRWLILVMLTAVPDTTFRYACPCACMRPSTVLGWWCLNTFLPTHFLLSIFFHWKSYSSRLRSKYVGNTRFRFRYSPTKCKCTFSLVLTGYERVWESFIILSFFWYVRCSNASLKFTYFSLHLLDGILTCLFIQLYYS